MKKQYNSLFIISGVFFLLIAFSSTMDLYHDAQDSLSQGHIAMEFFTLILSVSAACFFIFSAIKMKKENQALTLAVGKATEQKELYKKKVQQFSEGLSQAIEDEFLIWGLTKTETDIAFLILKGLSTKEISEIQGSQDKTVRHHCSAIYKKSGLKGRSELSAYFLEDLLVSLSPNQAL
jgi:DNA-binding CsgD family transcriptional regulator